MASGDLFRAFTVRFSFKKKQHVRMLQKFEDKKLNDGKSKNQIVMDALEVYYDVLGKKNQSGMQTELTPDYLEKRLSDMEESIRVKMLKEIVGIVLESAISGKRSVLLANWRRGKLWRIMKQRTSVVCLKLWEKLWIGATIRMEVDYGQ